MRSGIHLVKGRCPRQAHTSLKELGDLVEDELGRNGFQGRVAELYRRHSPIEWTRYEGNYRSWDLSGLSLSPSDQSDPSGRPVKLFYNEDVSLWVSRRTAPMPFAFRNVDGDEVYFVHEGEGVFETEFGPIPYEPGDWVVIPKCTTYRLVPKGTKNYFFIIEAVDEIVFPDFTARGLGRHVPFDPTAIFIPEPEDEPKTEDFSRSGEWQVRLKHAGEYTSLFYPFDPLDVVGWKGDLFPFKLNIRDYRTVMSDRMHLMPTSDAVFQARGVIIINRVPRRAETDPDTERLPPYHRNADYDEVLFTHSGSFYGAKLEPASINFQPQGLHHGFPKAHREELKRSWREHEMLDRTFVSIDISRPLKITDEARAVARHSKSARAAANKTEVAAGTSP
jgi:homogentisate 1,2-dioxygenase